MSGGGSGVATRDSTGPLELRQERKPLAVSICWSFCRGRFPTAGLLALSGSMAVAVRVSYDPGGLCWRLASQLPSLGGEAYKQRVAASHGSHSPALSHGGQNHPSLT